MSKKICIVYLVSPRSHTHSSAAMKQDGISKFEVFKESLKTAKKYLPDYPVIVFHEDYSDTDIEECNKVMYDCDKVMYDCDTDIGKELKFVKVDFENHPTVPPTKRELWQRGDDGGVTGRPWGYRMMCRFFCGVMQALPEIQEYDYYIRLDHDSFLMDPKPSRTIEEHIAERNFDYSLRSIFVDTKEKDALWDFTKKYLLRRGMTDKIEKLRAFGMLDGNGNYNGISPYNNYHVCRVDFWKRPDVREFLDAIENENGIVKYHWQDANIHGLLMGIFIDNDKIFMQTDFGYRHNFHYSVLGGKGIEYIHNGRPEDWP